MRKGGITLAVIGTFFGIAIGLGIVALQSFIGQTLSEMLDEEAQKACACRFKADDIDVSLLTLSAVAKRVGIEKDGVPGLRFNRINAHFGLSKIRDRQVNINLELIDGHASAIDSESPAVKFIGSLAAPIPPERDRPGRWKLKLQELKMSGSTFNQNFGSASLIGEGAALDVKRDDKNNFWLSPAISALKLAFNEPQKPGRTITLGRLSTRLYLEDHVATFSKLELLLKKTFLSGAMQILVDDGKTSGEFDYRLDSESLGLQKALDLGAKGRVTLDGLIDAPRLSGQTELTGPLHVRSPSGSDLLSFDKGSASWSLALGDKLQARIPQLEVNGEHASLRIDTPFSIEGDRVRGDIELWADSLALDAVEVKGLKILTSFDGTLDQPKIVSSITTHEMTTGGIVFPGPQLDLRLLDEGLEFALAQGIAGREALAAKGTVSFKTDTPRILDAKIEISELPLVTPSGKILPFTLKGSGTMSGPLKLAQLQSELNLTISPFQYAEGSPIGINAKLDNGKLEIAGGTPDRTLSIGGLILAAADRESSLSLKLNEFLPEKILPELGCLNFSGGLDYKFKLDAPLAGSGSVQLLKAFVGCEPYGLTLAEPANAKIIAGTLDIPSLSLVNKYSKVVLSGTISTLAGYDLRLGGKLELSSLLGVLSSMDELAGTITSDLRLIGPMQSPLLKGEALLSDLRFDIASADISAEHVNGRVVFDGERADLNGIKGSLNSGTFAVSGSVSPWNIESSRAEVSLSHILVEPDSQTSFIFSGSLGMQQAASGKPSVAGSLVIESGEFRDSINLQTIIKLLSEFILSSKVQRRTERELPDIELDVNVTASRNVFVLTNVATMELALDLRANGTLPHPMIDGKITVLTGWLGLKNRRFEITSGNLIFRPGSLTPEIDLIGETTVVSRTGEDAMILLQASGPISSPRFALSSDLGLDEREILRILSEGGYSRNETQRSILGSGFDEEESSLLSDFLTLNLRRVFRNLTRIDSIFLEPIYNPQTGVVEPGVIAEKRLAERLKIQGESSFSDSTNFARAKAVYDLTPNIGLAGLIETDAARKANPIEFNVTYTPISRQARILEVSVFGNSNFDRETILKTLRLGDFSRVRADESARLSKTLHEWYQSNGFMNALVEVRCLEETSQCRHLEISIDEGSPSYLKTVEITGDAIPAALAERARNIIRVRKGDLAEAKEKDSRIAALTRLFRSEGYISARLNGSFEQQDANQQVLIIELTMGRQVSFSFTGNSKFSPADFLATINLFGRKQPFGNNTINILIENIERLYREDGFLYVSINSSRREDPASQKIDYLIQIEEGSQAKVKKTSFLGLHSLSESELVSEIRARLPRQAKEILSPQYAVAEALDNDAAGVQAVLAELGFNQAEVSHEILPLEDKADVEIQYVVTEGPREQIGAVIVSGFDFTVESGPSLPTLPCSFEQFNNYTEALLADIKGRGFPRAALKVEPGMNDAEMHISIDAGPRTYIGEIKIVGLQAIESSVVSKSSRLATGDPLTNSAIQEARVKLLRLGLFSRVDIKPVDGIIDNPVENIVIECSERSLQTLNLGIGANSEYGLHVFGEASDRSLLADGRSLSLRVDTYYDRVASDISQGTASLRFLDPYFFDTDYSFTEDLRFQRLDLATYEFDLDRVSLSTYGFKTADDGLSISIGHTLMDEDLNNVSPDAVLSDLDTGDVRLSFLSGVANWDRRDSPINPSSGYAIGFDYRVASEAIASEANYYSLGAHGSYFLPFTAIDNRFGLAFNSRIESSWTFGGTEEVPISQRYYLGGRTTIRGFKENSLGPRGDMGSVLGGDLLVQNNAELRYFLTEDFALHTFVDAGTVYLRSEGVSADDLRYSSGFGVRYLSPIGPLGVELGLPLDRKTGESVYRVHFSIGSAF